MKRGSLAVVALLAGCRCSGATDTPPTPTPSVTASTAPTSVPQAPTTRTVFDFVDRLSTCDVEHLGTLVDFGTDATRGRFPWSTTPPSNLVNVEHDGSTWARVLDRKLTFSFYASERRSIFVSARVVGYAAKSAQVYLDDASIGTITFAREQIKIVKTEATTLPIDAGLHTITLRFSGRARESDAFADLDWVRVGEPEDAPATTTYGPPTLRDLVLPAEAIAGVPHRSLGLRAPGSVRCVVRVPDRGVLRASIGVLGTGPGDAEILVERDGQKPETVKTVHLDGEKPGWVDVEVPLAPFGGAIVGLELRATHAPKGGRVLFGDPAIVLPPIEPAPMKARAAIVVVLDGVEKSELPPWAPAPTPHLPTLGELAANVTVFDRHRAPSTIVASVMATLLTGLAPSAHGVTDANAKLSDGATTIGAIARDASVRTAMFTGVPYSFKAFGFANGWEKFVEISPASGEPASAPIDQAAQWIADVAKTADARILLVVHARGAHPPWDVSSKELAAVPPPDYTGVIDPRRAGESLARLRKRKAHDVLNESDRIRVRALETIALAGEDRALGGLVQALKTANLWDATLFMVTGDVASGADTSALFADGLDLRESLLALPLYVHFPGNAGARRSNEPTEIADLPRTALAALGLGFEKPGDARRGAPRTLDRLGDDLEHGSGGPLVAELGDHYAVRWADLVLSGRAPDAPRLCDLVIDPTCAFDRRDASPLATIGIFRRFVFSSANNATRTKREPASIDPDTQSALAVWGAYD